MDEDEFARVRNDAKVMSISEDKAKKILIDVKGFIDELTQLTKKYQNKIPTDFMIGPLSEVAWRLSHYNHNLEQQLLMRQKMYEQENKEVQP